MSLVMKANTLIDNSSTEEAITSLDLWETLGKLIPLGYTVIPPCKVADEKTKNTILDKILEIAEAKTGNSLDLSLNASAGNYKSFTSD